MIRPAPASLCARSHAMRVAWHGHRRACVQRGNRMLRLCAAPTDEELEVVEAEDEPFLIDEVDSELNDTVAVRQVRAAWGLQIDSFPSIRSHGVSMRRADAPPPRRPRVPARIPAAVPGRRAR
jgi:hypothetical protein